MNGLRTINSLLGHPRFAHMPSREQVEQWEAGAATVRRELLLAAERATVEFFSSDPLRRKAVKLMAELFAAVHLGGSA